MPSKLTRYVRWARERFPKSFKQDRIVGEGPFCVVHCSYHHPQVFLFGVIQLLDDESKAIAKTIEINRHGCSAKKECRTRHHAYYDLRVMAP